jgi:hypothetical protein
MEGYDKYDNDSGATWRTETRKQRFRLRHPILLDPDITVGSIYLKLRRCYELHIFKGTAVSTQNVLSL